MPHKTCERQWQRSHGDRCALVQLKVTREPAVPQNAQSPQTINSGRATQAVGHQGVSGAVSAGLCLPHCTIFRLMRLVEIGKPSTTVTALCRRIADKEGDARSSDRVKRSDTIKKQWAQEQDEGKGARHRSYISGGLDALHRSSRLYSSRFAPAGHPSTLVLAQYLERSGGVFLEFTACPTQWERRFFYVAHHRRSTVILKEMSVEGAMTQTRIGCLTSKIFSTATSTS
jgi:hypothetical protein